MKQLISRCKKWVHLILLLPNVSVGAPVLLDSMLITVNNQWSTKGTTFTSNQSFNKTMIIPSTTKVDYFLVELTNFQTSPTTPQNTVLEYDDTSRPSYNTHVERMIFYGDGGLLIGETLVADGTTHYRPNTNAVISSSGMYDIFSSFVNGPGLQSPWIATNSTSFSSAVDSPHIELEFTVTAYGEPSPVPIPATMWLLASGLTAITCIAKRGARSSVL